MVESNDNTSTPLTDVKPKTQLVGKVVKTTLAGVLVDLGLPVPGVIHISQLSDQSVKKVEDVLTVGQEVNAWVKKVKADRIELSLIKPLGLDWKDIKAEMVLKGTVQRLETYGAFVEIGAEKPGLVHVSEMGHGYVKTPSDVVKEGDEIDVMVLDVDRKKKQIRLSIKATLPEPEVKEEVRRDDKPRRDGKKPTGGKRKEKVETFEMNEELKGEPSPTAFESAWQAALEKSKLERANKFKKNKEAGASQDDFLDRTLKNRIKTN
jgi:ribosomal protein S1